ncbi:MAG TPA: tetratricopeptide repeat protein [Candidatus Goldiibacteriota bacterium]|nr:tetratricopeptide repeat protein [Candidatus Goldiibacteriota bacterium]
MAEQGDAPKKETKDDAVSLNNLGVYHYSKGMYQEAIENFKKAIELNPNYVQARENLKSVNKQTGIYDRAILAYRKAVQFYSEDPETYYNLGNALSYTGEYQESLKLLSRALELNPEHLLARNLMGVIYKNTGEYDKAEEVFKKALEKYPNYAEIRNNLGETLYKKGFYEEAEAELKKAVQINKEYALAYYNLSFVYGELSKDEEAQMCYNRAVELNPSFVQSNKTLVIEHFDEKSQKREKFVESMNEDRKEEAYYNLARVNKMKGYTDDAIREIKKAISHNGANPAYYNFFGELLIKKHLLSDAIEVFKQTLKIDPEMADAKVNIAVAYREMGDYKKALAVLDAVEEENPEFRRIELERAVVFIKQDLLDDAVKKLKAHLEKEPYDTEGRYYLGTCYYRLKRYDEAVTEFRSALELQPHYMRRPEINLYLGLVLTDKGRNEEAVIEYQKVISMQPNNAVAYNSMGVSYKNMGDLDTAIEYYKKAAEIDPGYFKAYNNLGVALYKKNFFIEAVKYFEKALEIEPGYDVARKNLEAAKKKDTVFKETITKLSEKAQNEEKNPAIHSDLGFFA